MRIFIYSCSPQNNENRVNLFDRYLYDFLNNNRDLIPTTCYFKNDSDLRHNVIDELTIFSNKLLKSNINDVFVSELIQLDNNGFIFCDYETVENIIHGLYKLTKNKKIISEIEDPCLIEINDSYKYLKIRNIQLDKIS